MRRTLHSVNLYTNLVIPLPTAPCRHEQKRITRDYLVLARSELQDIMAAMQDLEDRSKQLLLKQKSGK